MYFPEVWTNEQVDEVGKEIAIIEEEFDELMDVLWHRDTIVYSIIQRHISYVFHMVAIYLDGSGSRQDYENSIAEMKNCFEGYKNFMDITFEPEQPFFTENRQLVIWRYAIIKIPISILGQCIHGDEENGYFVPEDVMAVYEQTKGFLEEWSNLAMTTAEREHKFELLMNGELPVPQ